jgi:hypothetical protein
MRAREPLMSSRPWETKHQQLIMTLHNLLFIRGIYDLADDFEGSYLTILFNKLIGTMDANLVPINFIWSHFFNHLNGHKI